MRRLGSLAVTLALIGLGLSGGLWLGSPASAATPPIQVKMAGDVAYSTSTAKKLLDVSALAPGGTASGSMDVLDDSDNTAGSGTTDTITLKMINVIATDGAAGGPTKPGAGPALKAALDFTVTVTGPAGTIPPHGTLTVADLAAGITLASGLVNGNELHVSAAASLPAGIGNEVQYGQVAFDLELALTSSGGTTDNTGGGGTIGVAGAAAVQGNAGAAPEVAGENQELPPDQVSNQGAVKPGGSNILVLGEHNSQLPNTGVPLVPMLAVGGGVFLAGLVLLYASRRVRA